MESSVKRERERERKGGGGVEFGFSLLCQIHSTICAGSGCSPQLKWPLSITLYVFNTTDVA